MQTTIETAAIDDMQYDKTMDPLHSSMSIFVKMISGKTVAVNTNSTNTVKYLKHTIQEKEGIPVDDQWLVYSRKQLKDCHTLHNFNIHKRNPLFISVYDYSKEWQKEGEKNLIAICVLLHQMMNPNHQSNHILLHPSKRQVPRKARNWQ